MQLQSITVLRLCHILNNSIINFLHYSISEVFKRKCRVLILWGFSEFSYKMLIRWNVRDLQMPMYLLELQHKGYGGKKHSPGYKVHWGTMGET